MKLHKVKTLAWSAAVVTLALSITACGGSQSNHSNSAAPSSSPTQATESPSPSPTDTEKAKTGEGEYIGLMDPHSLEIKVDGQPTPFQIDPDLATQLSDWEPGTKVKFAYTEEELDVNGQSIKQLTITSIDKL